MIRRGLELEPGEILAARQWLEVNAPQEAIPLRDVVLQAWGGDRRSAAAADQGSNATLIIRAIAAGDLLRILPNLPYPGQLIAEVLVVGYVYRVLFRPVAGGTAWELITLYPNRRATRAWRTRRER